MKMETNNSSFESSTSVPEINGLAEALGFIETPELSEIRDMLTRAMISQSEQEVTTLASRYRELGESVVEQYQGDEYVRAQIGLSVAMALIRRDAGRTQDYIEDLDDMLMYAENSNSNDIIAVLDRAKVSEVIVVLKELGDEFGFDDETLQEISETSFEEAIELAYGYLTQAGLDADEVLGCFFRGS